MARKKSANGDGTLSKRKDKDGNVTGWKGAIVVGHKADGTLDRRWVTGKTQKEVQDKKDRLKAELHLGLVTDTKGITVGQFLDQWMNHKRVLLKPKSIEDYSWVIEHRLKPLIGRILLEKLKVLDIEHMVRSVREKTSPNAAKRARTVLRMALGQAVKWQMVPRNLADIVDVPKVEKKEMHVWEPGQVTRFLAVVQVHRLYALFHLALTTGMRCGELLALRWQDINWDKSTLQVRLTANEIRGHITFSTPKTPAAIRAIHLSPSTMEMLKAHHSRQARERQALEGGWTDSGLVFTSDVGTTLSNANVRRLFILQSTHAGLPCIRIHDMRHTAATAMIRRGYTANLVADILGHSDPGFTLKVYAHVWEEERRERAPSVADLYGPPVHTQPAAFN